MRTKPPPRAGQPSETPLLLAALTCGTLLCGSALASTSEAGDPTRGRQLLLARHDTGCILCHTIEGLPQGGALGPALQGLAQRYSADELQDRIADARRFNPHTIMPPTRSVEGLQRVSPAFQGKTLLTAQELRDIVAYLLHAPAASPPSGLSSSAPQARP